LIFLPTKFGSPDLPSASHAYVLSLTFLAPANLLPGLETYGDRDEINSCVFRIIGERGTSRCSGRGDVCEARRIRGRITGGGVNVTYLKL
jgi:hypothetical protein